LNSLNGLTQMSCKAGSVRTAPGPSRSSRCRPAPEALVYRLAAIESGFDRMPMLDGGLTQPPAKQHNLIVEAAREIE
jgi:hypothetical protein